MTAPPLASPASCPIANATAMLSQTNDTFGGRVRGVP